MEFSDGGSVWSQVMILFHTILQMFGMYDVSMTITTIEGCIFDTTFTQYIEVFDYPNAMFSYSPIPATIYQTEISFMIFLLQM